MAEALGLEAYWEEVGPLVTYPAGVLELCPQSLLLSHSAHEVNSLIVLCTQCAAWAEDQEQQGQSALGNHEPNQTFSQIHMSRIE